MSEAKEECPICFLPMPINLINCITLPPATISSVPVSDYALAHEELANMEMEQYYPCCGKSICGGCDLCSGNYCKCPFCNTDRSSNSVEDVVGELMKRVAANDAASIYMLACSYQYGLYGVQQDHARAMELFTRAAEVGYSKAHSYLGVIYEGKGDLKKAKFHFEAAALAGNEVARFNVGLIEAESLNMERAVKHWNIAASAGNYRAMFTLIKFFEQGLVSRESIDSTLTAYNSSCAEFRSEARDAFIQAIKEEQQEEEEEENAEMEGDLYFER